MVNPGGRWNHHMMVDHVIEHGTFKWVKIEDLAKVGLGKQTKQNIRYARSRLSGLCKVAQARNIFLAVEYNGGRHHSATAVKVADLSSELDRRLGLFRLDRMRKSKELTQAQYHDALEKFYAQVPHEMPVS